VEFTPPIAVVVAVVVLLVANLLNNRFAPRMYVTTSLVATALLLAVFRLAGMPWADAGLGRHELARGARSAAFLIALVGLTLLVGALLPATRRVFLDRRVRHASAGAAAYQVLVRIPVGTVLLEEVAFRGVLYALLGRMYGAVWAVVVSSVLFGLWHVLPAGELPSMNPAAGRAFQTRSALVVPTAVVVTALAGVVLCECQRRSGSLLAPATLHWAVNGLGYLTAFLVALRSSRSVRPDPAAFG
jgi:membrane protease YdiL (CAAX protease family)